MTLSGSSSGLAQNTILEYFARGPGGDQLGPFETVDEARVVANERPGWRVATVHRAV